MKGLILKDLYMVWSYCKAVIVVCIIFLTSSIFMEGNLFFSVYPVIIAGIIPFSILVYEEKFKWAVYCQSFPISRAKVVSGKYLLSLICVMAAIVLSAICAVVKGVVGGVGIKEQLLMVLTILPMAFIGPAIMLPFVFKYDVEKARLVYYIVVGGVCGMSAFISVDTGASFNITSGAAILISVAIFIISWVISVRIYENKEL